MGSSVIFDIITSTVIAGFLFLIILSLNGAVANATFTSSNELTVQENLVTLVQIAENDFRLLGWCDDPSKIADPTKAVREATKYKIKFLTDLPPLGSLDSISYYFDTTALAANTPNPRDRILFRTINTQTPQRLYLGLTQFEFKFYNSSGTRIPFPITKPSEIVEMELSITCESPAAYDTTYSYAYWKQLRLTSRNLRNR